MNLNMYIPFREAAIIYGNNTIPVLGISSFNIDIDRLNASYVVWVGCAAAQAVADIGAMCSGAINLTPNDISAIASMKIDDFTFPCTLTKCAYNPMRHAYGLYVNFTINKDHVRTYIYDNDDEQEEEHTRFDILDLG